MRETMCAVIFYIRVTVNYKGIPLLEGEKMAAIIEDSTSAEGSEFWINPLLFDVKWPFKLMGNDVAMQKQPADSYLYKIKANNR